MTIEPPESAEKFALRCVGRDEVWFRRKIKSRDLAITHAAEEKMREKAANHCETKIPETGRNRFLAADIRAIPLSTDAPSGGKMK